MPGCVRLVMVIAAFACGAPLPAQADTKVPETREMVMLSFAPLVKVATPAVVNIYATRVVEQADSPFAGDPFFSQFFGEGLSRPRVQNSLGSGVIVRQDGIVVSNYHVVGGASDIRVVLADRREFAAKVLLADEAADLAILSLEGASELPALSLANSDKAAVGDLVLAIGNPFGVGQTVTTGIVSGLARSGGEMGRGGGYFIQTDAAINPGNSGGPLVDLEGKVVGVNTAVNRSGQSIGFAIPINAAKIVIESVKVHGKIVRPWLGVRYSMLTAESAKQNGFAVSSGALLIGGTSRGDGAAVVPDSPAEKAGLKAGDVLLDVDGVRLEIEHPLSAVIAKKRAGDTVQVRVLRDGMERVVPVTLGVLPDAP